MNKMHSQMTFIWKGQYGLAFVYVAECTVTTCSVKVGLSDIRSKRKGCNQTLGQLGKWLTDVTF